MVALLRVIEATGAGEESATTVDGLLARETNTADLTDKDYCLSANGYYFRRDKRGLFPEIVAKLFKDRQDYKKLMIQSFGDEYVDKEEFKLKREIVF